MFKVAVFLVSLLVSSTLTAHQQTTEKNVVLMNVTVSNSRGVYERNKGPVSGLLKEAFSVYDNNVPQQIHLFTEEDTPVSVCIVLDTSALMIARQGPDYSMKTVAAAVSNFIEHSNRSNEYFLITFGKSPQLIVDWTGDGAAVVNAIASAKPGGGSQLLDACHLGLEKVSSRKNLKQVILLITQGQFAKSTRTLKELREEFRDSTALLYILDPPNTPSFGWVPPEVRELADETGGIYLSSKVQNARLLELHAQLIAAEIRRQYLIGFIPKDPGKGKKWHSLKVKVNPGPNPPPELKELFPRSRIGYWSH